MDTLENQRIKGSRSGSAYFLRGFSLIRTKGLKRFVLVPLLVNLLLFGGAFYYLFSQLDALLASLNAYIPDWLAWIRYLIWPIAFVAVVVGFSYIFSTVSNWIAAPFNGLLAEKVEAHLMGKPNNNDGILDAVKDIPRTLGREWAKLVYYIPKAIGFLIIFFLLPVIGQLIWFLFTAWMMSVQYADYPFDNHKLHFTQTRQTLKQHQGKAYSFGVTVTLFSMIPFVNMLVMPVAICGATAMWVGEFRQEALQK